MNNHELIMNQIFLPEYPYCFNLFSFNNNTNNKTANNANKISKNKIKSTSENNETSDGKLEKKKNHRNATTTTNNNQNKFRDQTKKIYASFFPITTTTSTLVQVNL